MSHTVFLRAANVGGRNVFRPAQLATALAHLEVVNIGAAGTLLVRGRATPAAIAREFRTRMAFEPELMIRPTREIVALVADAPFARERLSKDVRGWVAVLDGVPRRRPKLPVRAPDTSAWSVRIDRIAGAFVLGLWRRQPRPAFPNLLVERLLGVRATTRYWETIERIAALAARA